MTPVASWSRIATPVAFVLPLLPTTNVYVSPPRQTGGARRPSFGPACDGSSGMSPVAALRPSGGLARCWFGVVEVGQDRAQTGSGESAFVIVRSIAGRTVVDSESDAWTPWFLMLPVTVAVLKIDAP